MGFVGLLTNNTDGSWDFNTSVPWYLAEPCPGCIPMPSHNTSENYVWLDLRVTVRFAASSTRARSYAAPASTTTAVLHTTAQHATVSQGKKVRGQMTVGSG
eukprot:COSAG03_NODE_6522_length_1047_cov_1.312236_1_plen_100_part_01